MTPAIIIAPPRTGSTWLRQTLNKHPSISFYGELFSPNYAHGTGLDEEDVPVKEKVRLTLERENGGRFAFFKKTILENDSAEIVGFKMLYSHFGDVKNGMIVDYLQRNRDVKIIFLWRENLLSRYISEVLHRFESVARKSAKEKGDRKAWFGLPGKQREGLRYGPLSVARLVTEDRKVKINPDAFYEDACSYMLWKRMLKKRFRTHASLEVVYEDLCHNPSSEIDKIFKFLNVELVPVNCSVKTRDAQLRDRIANYNEISGIRSVVKYL